MKIAIDAMGGDDAPEVVIAGAKAALQAYSELETLILVGDQAQLDPLITQYALPTARIRVVHTDEMVEMHESGAKMLRKKKKASITLTANLVKQGDADAMVGAGNTGAAVANATIKLRTLAGISKAAIGSVLPSNFGSCLLMDAGANPDPRPENLVESAVMGSIYMRNLYQVAKPKVGIMSNGEEEEKGTDLTRAAHMRIKELIAEGKDLPFEYVGYVEGRDIFLTDLDVCVTDGFTGNVILKSVEGLAKGMSSWIRAEYQRNIFTKIAGLLSKPVFSRVRALTSHEKAGGSLLLGVNGICVIGHGSSTAFAIQNAIRLAMNSVHHEINPDIISVMDHLNA